MNKMPLALAAFFFLFVSGTTHAAPKDACSLLTKVQVSEALGVAVGAPEQHDEFNCEWSEPNKNDLQAKKVLLHIVGPAGPLTVEEQFNAIKAPTLSNRITKTPVSGLGDEALYGIVGVSPPELTVRKGKFVFQISIHGLPRNQINEIEAKEKALAQDVLAKL